MPNHSNADDDPLSNKPRGRILFLAPQPFFEVRGTPINVRRMLETLGGAGYTIDLITYPVGEDIDLPGVTITRVPGWPGLEKIAVGPSLVKIPLDFLMLMYALFFMIRRRYLVIHAVEEAALFCPFLLWFRRGVHFVYDMDSCMSDQLRYSGKLKNRFLLGFVESLEKRAAARSDFVLTVCSALTEWVNRNVPGKRVVQIEDTPLEDRFEIDREAVLRLRAEWGIQPGELVSVYTGNLESYQGIELMLEALAIVQKQWSADGATARHRCVIVGGGEGHISDMRAYAESLGLESPGDLVWAGRLPMSQIATALGVADLLLSPRIKGTNTAMKVYGYMQSWKPILATDLPTHCQVLDASTSMLVAPNPEAFAAGWVRLLQDPDLRDRLGTAAAARLEERYSLPRFRARLLEAYADFAQG